MLWQRHWSEPSRQTRNALLVEYAPLVAQAVQRVPYQMRIHHEPSDLESYGVLGLLLAIERFDPSSTLSRFPAYALIRIRGAILDELRRLDWLPRKTRREVVAFTKASEALIETAGRIPERREVLAEMGAGEKQSRMVDAALPASQLLSLNAPAPSAELDTAPLSETLSADQADGPESRCVEAACHAALRSAFAELNERQRIVLDLHIVERRAQSHIGEVLGISASRVCQLERDAIERARARSCNATAGRRRRPGSARDGRGPGGASRDIASIGCRFG